MAKGFLTLITLLVLIFISSCVPEPSSRSKKGSSDSPSSSDDKKDSNNSDPEENLFWFSSGQNITGSLTLNENLSTVIYLRGESVHNFLNLNQNNLRQYCLIASFSNNSTAIKKHLRLRAIPISFNDYLTGSIKRVLRIDISGESTNSALCSGSAAFIDQNGILNTSVSGTTADTAFSLPNICPTCSGSISSQHIDLYEIVSNVISDTTRIPISNFNPSGLALKIDTSSSSTSQGGTCSNSTCQAQGFNCCLDGQCVKDGSLKPNAQINYPSDYAQALAEIIGHPNKFTNWPNIFFVCSATPTDNGNTDNSTDDDDNSDPQTDANQHAENLLNNYYCLEGAKKTPADYTGCLPSKDQAAFIAIRSQTWASCGCKAVPFPTDPQNLSCPDFGLQAIKNGSGNITSIICDVPPPTVDPSPSQSLGVSVSVRSVPHRFFSKDSGQSFDDLSEITNSIPVIEQEGDKFFYLDSSGKTNPQIEDFGMNAIFGQMDINLSKALPAKMIQVNFDQSYLITSGTGYYTPCPQCTQDSWFGAFSAFPSLKNANGLVSIGYTTSRDSYSINTTNGNYEDTVFGRACWLPPTMLPFSHRPNNDLQQQRLDRLKTQATLYANGYQKDWYGFNKGALIGSFDGVKWFAIGSSRKVTATSSKLFLAINSPFADIADSTSLSVNIIADLIGNTVFPTTDYDPSLSLTNTRQNQAASCQANHQCQVDSDCVTKLGWEYVCLDTGLFETKWPEFDVDGNEIANKEIDNATFNEILQNPVANPDSNKRCVYRGAGAVCKRNYKSNLSPNHEKYFTCASNFYCESTGGNNFNSEVAREPKLVDNILFGQEANRLGRPLHYSYATKSLTPEIKSNLDHNFAAFSSAPNDFGLCRPGRRLSLSDPGQQHQNKDVSRRSDYISQIGSCDSNLVGSPRVWACPTFETEASTPSSINVGDYISHNDTTIDIDIFNKRHIQNSCGGETLKEISIGSFISPFLSIESDTLSSFSQLSSPSVAKNSCKRRAGAICHTDLDCSPNKLQAELAQAYGVDFFGNTSAEKNYWTENLVCGQAQPKPQLQASNFFDYDMTKNRCCREIGQDITMFTQGTTTIIPDLGNDNVVLQTDNYPLNAPASNGRYSRYTVAGAYDASIPTTTPYPQSPKLSNNTTPKHFQWKAIYDTGRKTCCGGGFIRKFADGTNNWGVHNRLSLNVEAFTCLNYRSTLPFENPGNAIDPDNYDKDADKLCLAPADGGCMQYPIAEAVGFEVTNPTDDATTTTTVDTSPINDPIAGGILEQAQTNEAPYQPVAYNNVVAMSANGPFNFFASVDFDHGVSFYLPIYIAQANITSIKIKYFKNELEVGSTTPALTGVCDPSTFINPIVSMPIQNTYCIIKDQFSINDVFHARAVTDLDANPGTSPDWDYAGVEITFAPFNTVTAGTALAQSRMLPGNVLYYLTKLARLELIGVPQIAYEPLYCNNNRENLVEGIFSTNPQTRTEFENAQNSFIYDNATNNKPLNQIYDSTTSTTDASNPDNKVTYQNKLALPQIFSGHEFKCCLELGEKTQAAGSCCSNHAAEKDLDNDGQSALTCILPAKTDLNVYFNKFISGEGFQNGELTDDDFIPETGEPKLRQSTYDKLATLGDLFCENGIRQGGAFGRFYGEPNSGFFQQNGDAEDGRIYSIIDSTFDDSSAGGSSINDEIEGTATFLLGYKWNHHFYCK